MRLIDADALRNVFDAMHAIQGGSHFDHLVLLGIKKHIEDAPTIDAEPVRHGQWEYIKTPGGMMTACSECGEIPDCFEPNYCPHCGAKMDGGDSDEEE